MTRSADWRRGYGPALAFAGLVLLASLVPVPDSTTAVPALFGVDLDKWVHAASYALLTGLLAWGRRSREWVAVAALAVLATGYGAAIELLQTLVATRGLSTADVLANAVGAAVAAIAYIVARSR